MNKVADVFALLAADKAVPQSCDVCAQDKEEVR
jgi:hypothetical protein